MSRRATLSVLGAAALLAASVVGASSASALTAGATTPTTQSFGNTALYTNAVRTITVTASGEAVTFGAAPTIGQFGTSVGQDADYSVVSETCSGEVITAGGTCTVTVQFQPFALGLRQAVLSIASTTPAATVNVTLSGTGVPDATGTYYQLPTPARFLDTGSVTPLGPDSTVTVQITGKSGIPATGVSAVVINLTADKTTASGFFTTYPSDKARPTASSLNFPKAWTGANMVTVPVGADGKIKLYNRLGSARAIVDVMGWYAKDDTVRAGMGGIGAQFRTTGTGDPERLFDSRSPEEGNLPFINGEYIEFTDTWNSSAEAAAVRAYAMTITAVGATKGGFFTAWAGGTATKPSTSTLNYQAGVVAPNMAIVPVGHSGAATDTTFRILNSGSGSVHMIVDITGYYIRDDAVGLRFKPISPALQPRILDTRNGTGLSGAFVGGVQRTAPASSVSSVDSAYLVGNTTGVQPTKATYLTIWSGLSTRPNVSNLNVNPGLVRAVSAYAPLRENVVGVARTYNLYSNSGSMHVLFDVAGTLDLYPSSTVAAPAGALAPSVAQGRGAAGLTGTAAAPEDSGHRRG